MCHCRNAFLGLLLVSASTLALPTIARAAATPHPDEDVDPMPDDPDDDNDYRYTYDLNVNAGEKVRPNPDLFPPGVSPPQADVSYFTIYDVYGLIPGSVIPPTDWAVDVSNSGPIPPGAVIIDKPNVPNITLYYVGTSEVVGPIDVGAFSFESVYRTEYLGQYAASLANSTTNLSETNQGHMRLPVPEPSTVMPLLAAVTPLVLRRRELQCLEKTRVRP